MASDSDIVIKKLDKISFEDSVILISGGAGFIGSAICDLLIRQNAEVVCIDNLASGQEYNIRHLLGLGNFTFINQDVNLPLSFNRKIDYVMHLASRASPLEFEKFPLEILKSNTVGLLNFLEIAKKHRARLIFASTSEVYGQASQFPTPETNHGNVNSIGIRGCYDEAKRAGEAYCMAYMRQHQLDIRIARIFNTYGPKMRGDGFYGRVIPRFIQQAIQNKPITIFGDGSQTRSFCYITDQVEGLLRLLFNDNARGEVVNIGYPEEITILTLAGRIQSMTNSTSDIEFHPLPEDDPPRRLPDISKAEKILNWHPSIDLNKGLSKTIEYFKSDYGSAN